MFRIDVDGEPGRRHRLLAGRARRRAGVGDGLERRAGVAGARDRPRGAAPGDPPRRRRRHARPARRLSGRRQPALERAVPRARGSSTADRRPRRGAAASSTFNIWVLDMSPLDLAGREPDVDERFAGDELDRVALVAVLHAALGVARATRPRGGASAPTASSCASTRTPHRGRRSSTATSASRTCRPASSRDRSAATSASTGSATDSSCARSSPSSGCGLCATA